MKRLGFFWILLLCVGCITNAPRNQVDQSEVGKGFKDCKELKTAFEGFKLDASWEQIVNLGKAENDPPEEEKKDDDAAVPKPVPRAKAATERSDSGSEAGDTDAPEQKYAYWKEHKPENEHFKKVVGFLKSSVNKPKKGKKLRVRLGNFLRKAKLSYSRNKTPLSKCKVKFRARDQLFKRAGQGDVMDTVEIVLGLMDEYDGIENVKTPKKDSKSAADDADATTDGSSGEEGSEGGKGKGKKGK